MWPSAQRLPSSQWVGRWACAFSAARTLHAGRRMAWLRGHQNCQTKMREHGLIDASTTSLNLPLRIFCRAEEMPSMWWTMFRLPYWNCIIWGCHHNPVLFASWSQDPISNCEGYVVTSKEMSPGIKSPRCGSIEWHSKPFPDSPTWIWPIDKRDVLLIIKQWK